MRTLNKRQIKKLVDIEPHFKEFAAGENIIDIIHMQYALLFTALTTEMEAKFENPRQVWSELRDRMITIHQEFLNRVLLERWGEDGKTK